MRGKALQRDGLTLGASKRRSDFFRRMN